MTWEVNEQRGKIGGFQAIFPDKSVDKIGDKLGVIFELTEDGI